MVKGISSTVSRNIPSRRSAIDESTKVTAVAERIVTANWLGGFQVDVDAGEFGMRVDEPESVGGTNTGPQPTDLLLGAIASCFVLSLAYSAAKRKIALASIGVEVTGTYEGQRFSHIEIAVDIPVDEDVAQMLIASASRVCYVTNTIKQTPEIVVRRT
jgi:hypothetical protein